MTHKGSGLGQAQSQEQFCAQSTVLDGLAIWGDDIGASEDDVLRWLRGLRFQV
jgi:hypothetical protein